MLLAQTETMDCTTKENKMDEIDAAQAHIEREEEFRRRYHNPNRLDAEPTGKCLNCGATLSDRRWCDDECREDWELRRRK